MSLYTATALQHLWYLPKNKTLSKKEQAARRQPGTEAAHSRCQACGLFVLTGQTWNGIKDAKSTDQHLEPELPLACLLPDPMIRSPPWTPVWGSVLWWHQIPALRSRQGLRASLLCHLLFTMHQRKAGPKPEHFLHLMAPQESYPHQWKSGSCETSTPEPAQDNWK